MDSSTTSSQQLPQQLPPVEVPPQHPQQVAPQTASFPPKHQQADPASVDQLNQPQPVAAEPPSQQPPTAPNPPGQPAQPEQSYTQQSFDPQDGAFPPVPPNESAIVPGMAKPMPEEVLFEWQALSRPYKARNRQYFTTIGLIAALVALILLFAGQMFTVAVIASVVFVIYVLNTTPPGMVAHKLTTYGIRVENNLYYWEEMGRFWFTQRHGENILNIEIGRFPNRLTLLLGTVDKEDMQLVLSEVLLNQQPPPTAYEKAAAWLQEKLPLDIES